MLEALAYCIKQSASDQLRVLQVLEPTVKVLFQAGRCENIDVDEILKEIKCLNPIK